MEKRSCFALKAVSALSARQKQFTFVPRHTQQRAARRAAEKFVILSLLPPVLDRASPAQNHPLLLQIPDVFLMALVLVAGQDSEYAVNKRYQPQAVHDHIYHTVKKPRRHEKY